MEQGYQIPFLRDGDKPAPTRTASTVRILPGSVAREGQTIRRIRVVVRNGTLREPFSPKDVNRAIGITFAGVFLPKHRIGNPGQYGRPDTELFEQVSTRPARYRLATHR